MSRVTGVIVHFNTPDLLERAVASLRRHYGSLSLLIADNGSGEASFDALQRLKAAPFTEVIAHGRNLHHGPAMDDALRRISTPYALLMDSDCTVVRGGFIERMIALLEEGSYAAGKLVHMNKRGFDSERGIPYIRPICMLIKREQYLTLPPFERHGAPCLRNMTEAGRQGHRLADFPVEEYVEHEGRGTAGRYGYDLGMRGRINHLLNKLGL